ncbi:MAG: 30S ribosomal protein S27ae [Nanoarchaeota archaeon]
MAKKKPTNKKTKEAKKAKRTSKVSNNYSISGDKLEKKNKFCPKCGKGVFLANHNDRRTCGKCNYMEKI